MTGSANKRRNGKRTCHLRYFVYSTIFLCSAVFFIVVSIDVMVLQKKINPGLRTIISTNLPRLTVDESMYDININVSRVQVNLTYVEFSSDPTGRINASTSDRLDNHSGHTHSDADQALYDILLRRHGMESTALHDFKSPYIVDPVIYDNDVTIPKAPGKRNTKIISGFNCPKWFIDHSFNQHNRDFKRCPYSECFFDGEGQQRDKADVVMFFPNRNIMPPGRMPPRPIGQIWAFCSWESPVGKNYISDYSVWNNVFNWTLTYRLNSELSFLVNRLVWRDSAIMLPDAEYQQIANGKTKTAAWFVSNCGAVSKRMAYVKEMQKYIDIDIYGSCGTLGKCFKQTCLARLNDTYKFYLGFENSICRDYVTEKLFRNFDSRLQVVPVVRGGFEYEKYIPPNTFINANNFKSAKELALYLEDLGNDITKYSKMLKEKDRLKTLNYKHDWCETCERLHTGVKPKEIADLRKHWSENACWN